MVAIINSRLNELSDLCRRHHVRRLEIFGSTADGTFDPTRSDIDFLVEYEKLTPNEHYEAYFGLWEDLQTLFNRKIDLVEPQTIRNPFVMKEVNAQRTIVYEA